MLAAVTRATTNTRSIWARRRVQATHPAVEASADVEGRRETAGLPGLLGGWETWDRTQARILAGGSRSSGVTSDLRKIMEREKLDDQGMGMGGG